MLDRTNGGEYAGHLSLTICDTSLLADRRRELQNLARMATYTMSLLNSKSRPNRPVRHCTLYLSLLVTFRDMLLLLEESSEFCAV